MEKILFKLLYVLVIVPLTYIAIQLANGAIEINNGLEIICIFCFLAIGAIRILELTYK